MVAKVNAILEAAASLACLAASMLYAAGSRQGWAVFWMALMFVHLELFGYWFNSHRSQR